jgi:hypothetical protein
MQLKQTPVGYIMLGAYFSCSLQITSGVLLIFRKRLLALPLAYRLQNPPANGRQGTMPEEMSLTLLTKKKQGKTSKYTLPTFLSKLSLAFTGRNRIE